MLLLTLQYVISLMYGGSNDCVISWDLFMINPEWYPFNAGHARKAVIKTKL